MNDESYIEKWFQEMMQRSRLGIQEESEAWGRCARILGPRQMHAGVRIRLSPALSFEVAHELEEEEAHKLQNYDYYMSIIFGVLDVLLMQGHLPITKCRLTILDAEIHEVHSSQMAFRFAARDATSTILKNTGFLATK